MNAMKTIYQIGLSKMKKNIVKQLDQYQQQKLNKLNSNSKNYKKCLEPRKKEKLQQERRCTANKN